MSAIGGHYEPHREKCAAYGPCQTPSHSRGHNIVTKWTNNTTIGGQTLAPLPIHIFCGSPHSSTAYDGTNYDFATPPYGPWTNALYNSVALPVNTYVADGTIDLVTPCTQVGWQAVVAKRYWHGALDFNSAGTIDTVCVSPDPAPSYQSYQSGFAQTKYLNLRVDIEFSEVSAYTSEESNITDINGATFEGDWSATGTFTRKYISEVQVNANSGIRTQFEGTETCSFSGTLNSNYSIDATHIFQGSLTGGAITGDCVSISTPLVRTPAVVISGTTYPSNWVGQLTTTWGATDWATAFKEARVEKGLIIFQTSGFGTNIIGAASGNYMSLAQLQAALVSIYPTITLGTFVLTATEFSGSWSIHTYDAYSTGNPLDKHDHTDEHTASFSFLQKLKVPNTAASVVADAEDNLLTKWNLLDRTLMPLNVCGWGGYCVKVTRNERQGNVAPTYESPSFSDEFAVEFDGTILGAPNVKEAPTDYFDFRYQRYEDCAPNLAVYSYGAYLSVCNPNGAGQNPIPPRATQWTNTHEARGLVIGRWRRYAQKENPSDGYDGSADGVLWVSKWVESSVRLPSFDHARPYGTDRNLDALTGTCAGDVWTPDGLRFTSPTPPPFGGRLAIFAVTDNHDGTVTFTTATSPIAFDVALDVCNLGMTALATSLTPSAATTTSFTATVTYATVASAKWVICHAASGVANWYCADNYGKGNYVLGEWVFDQRTAGEATRLAGVTDCSGAALTGIPYISGGQLYNGDGTPNYGYKPEGGFNDLCKGYIDCAPWLIVLSPNIGDTPAEGLGVRYDLSGVTDLDEVYGSYQWLTAIQAMGDPLFAVYPTTAQRSCDGSPAYDGCLPLVEARSIMPHATGTSTPPDNGAGAAQTEAAPSGAHWIDYTWVHPSTANTGNVVYPPIATSSEQTQPVHVYTPDGYFHECTW